MSNWATKDIESLADAFLTMKNKEEMISFMRDLLTLKEMETFSKRWKAAKMLDRGLSYRDIEKETGLSSATISRVNQFREYGMGGYRKALDRVKNGKAR